MLAKRLIARLDIKGSNVVKGIRFEGLRVMGNPIELAKKYAEQGAHEILYIDTVASLYGRNQLERLLAETTREVFTPVTVGGGIRNIKQAGELLNAGADKVAINTYGLQRPQLIKEISAYFGSQAVCVSIQCKKTAKGYKAYQECGREKTGKDAQEWAEEAVSLGAGELLITSIDQDGTMKGCDFELIKAINVSVPVVYCGGISSVSDVQQAFNSGADAIALGSALHYNKLTFEEIENGLASRHIQAKERRYA